MHLIETFSGVTGLKIKSPFIHTDEVSLPSGKYITFHPTHKKGNRRNYKRWSEVIDGIRSEDYEIVQVGDRGDFFDVYDDYLENTTMNQLAYIIQHSSLHLGYDSFPVHLSSYFKVPVVAIYNQWSSHSYPYFSDPATYRIIEPDYSVIKPSFSDNDPFDLINTINPQNIIKAVKELL